MDPRRLLVFREVARAGSLTAAARALGWTQPAVSQHLAALERSVALPLVLRGPTGTTLTEAGEVLLRRADAVAAELHAAGEELAALAQLRAGRVRLQAHPSAAATLVPDAVRALATSHPGVSVGLVEAEPPEALAAVEAGDADLALAFGYDAEPVGLGSLVWRPLLTEPVHLVLPRGAGSGAASGPRVELADLADADWIGGCERCRVHLVDCCRAAGFEPALRHETDDYVVVQNLVARGLGVTALPQSALTAYRHPGVRVVEEEALGHRVVGVAHRPGADQVPATAALLEEIRRVAT
ncbi:LysR family transcriptional regulator [uncultured Nocardioides sp.]|uniref:LysR family transcriptional regulator n=1 Tax=uncultured Nocardioides sp. TaxID=198441 RepID=UPI000C3DA2B7|nr:LysR family transcriptional regulator [uncultured Nocardioides sp.]MAO79363.1 LysR family transcriptional regulator [Nocardioides sp.]